MYLKSLTLRGFKSFAERTSLKFEPGITAIVGPNGSGKSNITDAVLWVLGEQSARSLRGSSMEDVIFAGSSNRPPLGLAEVLLCLDNSNNKIPIEFSEVTVSRRVFRSGESEYRINNSACRLLDIQELLSDSGLGRELYSVVSQGKLEEVLNSRAEERRTLIDEAAGVLKYRKRKEKAVRKMSAIEQNIIRLKDIIREIEKQIRPLQDQANQAQIFNQLSSELRDLEISLAVAELKELQSSWEAETDKQTSLKNRIDELKNSLKTEEEKTRALRAELENRGSESGSLQDRNNQLERALERLLGNLSLLEEKERNINERLKGLEQEDNDLKLRLAQREKELSQSRNELREIIEDLNLAARELDYAKEEESRISSRMAYCGNDIEEKNKLLAPMKERIAEREKLLAEGEAVLGNLNNEVSLLTTRMQASRVRGEEAKRLIEHRQKFLEDISLRISLIAAGLRDCLLKGIKCSETKSVEQLRQELVTHFEKELATIQMRLEKRKEIDQLVTDKLDEKSRELVRQKEQIAVWTKEIDKLRESLSELEKGLADSWAEREEARSKIDSLKNDMGVWQVKIASLDERRNSLERLIGNQRAEIREIEISRQERLSAMQRLRDNLDRVNLLKGPFYRLLRRVEKELKSLKDSAKGEAIAFGDVRQLIRENEANENLLRQQVAATQERLHEVELFKAQLELKVQAAVQKIVDEYNLPLERALEKYPQEIDSEDAEKRARKLRSRIASLGPINPIAIQEYNALESRHNLLLSQCEDLSRSRKMLFKILREIDKKIEGTFLETFKEVNSNFQILFSSLFPGGKGELTLTEPDNVLESGVEIEVYPDGKKAQKLSLLSGGERALVALALLFAIYLRRPSPFYILDEVEAALDDVNIQRFIGLLNKIREQSQFLIITHQKRTMEAANSLYGVTMQADGVSHLVSQKMN